MPKGLQKNDWGEPGPGEAGRAQARPHKGKEAHGEASSYFNL